MAAAANPEQQSIGAFLEQMVTSGVPIAELANAQVGTVNHGRLVRNSFHEVEIGNEGVVQAPAGLHSLRPRHSSTNR